MNVAKLPGRRLICRDFGRQMARDRICVAVLGVPVIVAAGLVCPGKGAIN
ncbi:hypothetical protein [Mangrovicoccus sp. HB161399]|nr:hypothetical protein [Mangrovicoccus sp. HB161399]